MAIEPTARELRDLKRQLAKLSDHVLVALDQLDRVMRLPENAERGKQVATIANWLEFANDRVRRFALDAPIDAEGKRVALKAAKKRYLAKPRA